MKAPLPVVLALHLAVAPLLARAADIDHLKPVPLTPQTVSGVTLAEHAASLYLDAGERAPAYAVFWRDGQVRVERFRGLRERPAPFDWSRPENEERIFEADYDEPPLLAFVLFPSDDGPGNGRLAIGIVPGLSVDDRIREGWRREVEMGGTRWTVRGDYEKGPGGRVLPGSMRLTVQGTGPQHVVLDRTPGLIFREQSILWIGDVTGEGEPDFLVRRTLLTGEVDHVLSLSRGAKGWVATGATLDPDRTERGLSYGIADAEETAWRTTNSPRPYAAFRVPAPKAVASYALAGTMQVRGIAIVPAARPAADGNASEPAASRPPVTPRVKRDFVFTFAGERYRIVAEVVATWSGEPQGPAYTPDLPFGTYWSESGLSLVVSIQHRSVKQALLVTQPVMDDDPMRLTAGDLDGSGRLSLTIDSMPHYNNAMTHTWTRVEEPGRIMKRVSTFQAQGC
jgi:hypothetical protein